MTLIGNLMFVIPAIIVIIMCWDVGGFREFLFGVFLTVVALAWFSFAFYLVVIEGLK
jgi:hypothetical protein